MTPTLSDIPTMPASKALEYAAAIMDRAGGPEYGAPAQAALAKRLREIARQVAEELEGGFSASICASAEPVVVRQSPRMIGRAIENMMAAKEIEG